MQITAYFQFPHVQHVFQAHSAYGLIDGVRLDELNVGGSSEASKNLSIFYLKRIICWLKYSYIAFD